MIRTTAGFTLVELLVVLLILSVVLIAVPIAYDRIKPRLEMRSEAREIAQILRDARGRAIRDNEETTVTIDVSERYLRSGDHGPRICKPAPRTSKRASPNKGILPTAFPKRWSN